MGKGSNSTGLRRYNERVLLTTLRNLGSASKSDLAQIVNLTPQAVTRIIDDLDSSGLVSKRGKRLGGKGQPSVLYSVEPGGAYSIGVKLGRVHLEILLMDFSGEVLEHKSFRYEYPDPDFLMDTIAETIEVFKTFIPEKKRDRLLGVGIAMPWFMSEWTEEMQMPPELAERWADCNFDAEMRERTDLPVIVENDCAAAAIAELLFGRGIELSDFLYVNIGTLVGGGLVIRSKLEPGFHGNAAALGSMIVPPSTLSSAPDSPTEFEYLLNRASLFALRRHINASGIHLAQDKSISTVIDQARTEVQEWLSDCADALVHAILNASALLDLEAIVIDGVMPPHLIGELVDMVSRRINRAGLPGIFIPQIYSGKIGADAVSRGGAILPFYSEFAPNKSILLKGGVPARVSI